MNSDILTSLPILCPGHRRSITSLSCSNITDDGCFLLSGSKEPISMLRNSINGDWIGNFCGHQGAIYDVKIDTSGYYAVTASADCTCKLFSAINGNELYSFNEQEYVLKCVDMSYDNQFIYTGGMNNTIQIYDINKTDTIPRRLYTNNLYINKIKIIDQNLLLTGCNNGEINLYDLRINDSNNIIKSIKLEHNEIICDLDLSLNHNLLSFVSNNEVYFYNYQNFELIKSKQFNFNFLREGCISIHSRGKFFSIGGSDLNVYIYSIDNLKQVGVLKGHHGPITCNKWLSYDDKLASGSEDGTIRIWTIDMNELKEINEEDIDNNNNNNNNNNIKNKNIKNK